MTFDLRRRLSLTPLEPRQIGALAASTRHDPVATPTFLRSYLRRCEPDDLRSLEVVFAGAEKLPAGSGRGLSRSASAFCPWKAMEPRSFRRSSPATRPPHRDPSPDKSGNRIGTIGRALQGVEVKVVDLDTGEDLPCGRQGMLLVRGPNVMKGYLNRPDLTAEVMRGDWYVTGDVAAIDADGFITITGRDQPLLENRRRNGAAHGRGSRPFARPSRPTTRSAVGRDRGGRRQPRRTARRAAHGLGMPGPGNLPPRWCPAVFHRYGSHRPTVSGKWRPFRSWGQASSTCRG